MTVDPEDPKTLYAGTEHSGLFYTKDAGAHWHRADPQVPKMFLYSALALNGGVMVGTIPSAVYRSKNGGWEELEGVRLHSAGANFPPSPELQSRTRYLAYDPENKNRLYAGIEVGGMVLSDDGGRGWEPCNEGLTDMDIHEILASEQHSGMVFLACGESCFRSPDRAGHWENISPKNHDYGISVAEDKNGVIYVGAAHGRPNLWLARTRRHVGDPAQQRQRQELGNGHRQFERRRHAPLPHARRQRHGRRDLGRNAARRRRQRRA